MKTDLRFLERKKYGLPAAVKIWISQTGNREIDGRNMLLVTTAVEGYASEKKIDVNWQRFAVIWLRMLLLVRAHHEQKDPPFPEINPKALSTLLEFERRRHATDRFLLYTYIKPSTGKLWGPVRKRTPSKRMVGYTSLEILFAPIPGTESDGRWPYHLEWNASVASRVAKTRSAQGTYESYKKKWGALVPKLARALQVEFARVPEGPGDAQYIEKATARQGRLYKATVPLMELAEFLIGRYQALAEYSPKTVRRALSVYVVGRRGRPPLSRKPEILRR